MDTKQCHRCKETKLFSEFWRAPGNPFNLAHICRECMKKDLDKNREKKRAADRAHYQRYAEEKREKAKLKRKNNTKRTKAHMIVSIAVRSGRLPHVSTQFCFCCGTCSEMGATMQYHHVDYDHPLEVIPICACCHALLHSPLNYPKGTIWLQMHLLSFLSSKATAP